MSRIIPGTVNVQGRRFLYIEWSDSDSFADFFYKIPTFGNSPLPTSGANINEDVVIGLPNGKKIFGISFKGDLEGWERKVQECCEANRLNYGKIERKSILLSNGDLYPLSECSVEFY